MWNDNLSMRGLRFKCQSNALKVSNEMLRKLSQKKLEKKNEKKGFNTVTRAHFIFLKSSKAFKVIGCHVPHF